MLVAAGGDVYIALVLYLNSTKLTLPISQPEQASPRGRRQLRVIPRVFSTIEKSLSKPPHTTLS